MNPFQLGALIGIKLLRAAAAVLATAVVFTSSYVLWDMWQVDHAAFTSYDMEQYRPQVENGEPVTFEEVQEVNEDVGAWVTAYNTHIDYPVAQGKDDLEYVNKDIFGKTTPAGSIYLSAQNASDYSDPYNLLYGHHVASGAMFGDVTNFTDKEYFDSHVKGILITPDGVWDLEFFACLETTAYDANIYMPSRVRDVSENLLPYIKENAKQWRNLPDITKVIALSTCDDSRTNGRTIIFAKMTPHEGPYEQYTGIDKERIPLAGSHGDRYWAFLNLVCLIVTWYLTIPLHLLKTKLRRKKTMKKRNEFFDDMEDDNEEEMKEEGAEEETQAEETEEDPGEEESDEEEEEDENAFYDIKRFSRRAKRGETLEIVTAIIALIAFILTEDIRLPIQMIDKWTPLMILLLVIAYLFDVRLLRYRVKDEDEEEEEGEEIDEEGDELQEEAEQA